METQNSQNPNKGKDFQDFVKAIFSEKFNVEFEIGKAIAIGNPAKDHKFSLVSTDFKKIVITKDYSWTETGNVPSAKMATLNEAVFYLQHVSAYAQKFLVIRKDRHPKRNETLGEYYARMYKHLLDDVEVLEVDLNTGDINYISK